MSLVKGEEPYGGEDIELNGYRFKFLGKTDSSSLWFWKVEERPEWDKDLENACIVVICESFLGSLQTSFNEVFRTEAFRRSVSGIKERIN